MLGRLALNSGRRGAPVLSRARSLLAEANESFVGGGGFAVDDVSTSTPSTTGRFSSSSPSFCSSYFSSSAKASWSSRRGNSSDEEEGEDRRRSTEPSSSSSSPTSILVAAISSRPESLEWGGGASASPAPGTDGSRLRRALLRLGGFYSTESRLIRGARKSYDAVVAQATDGTLVDALGLRRDNFADTHSLLCLYVWLLLVRLRSEGDNGAQAAQLLYDFFSDDAEARVRAAGVRVRVSKWLAELEKMFYGAATAYDKALGSPGSVGGSDRNGKADGKSRAFSFAPPADARSALSDALLRNVFGVGVGEGGGEEERRRRKRSAALLADYVIREIACLSQTDSDAVLDGRLRFTAVGDAARKRAAVSSLAPTSTRKDSDDEKAA